VLASHAQRNLEYEVRRLDCPWCRPALREAEAGPLGQLHAKDTGSAATKVQNARAACKRVCKPQAHKRIAGLARQARHPRSEGRAGEATRTHVYTASLRDMELDPA
jgi:hypothetical protein